MTDFADPVQAQVEPEVMTTRRAFAISQQEFAGSSQSVAASSTEVVWHGTNVHPERGALAVVSDTGPLAELVGEIVLVTRLDLHDRKVLAYVIASADITADISLARRAFRELGVLANEFVPARVEVIE